ncbi:MAG: response regulator transcription factor [Eubacteriaceae bacterium]|nr:response regulator transcription factor [Eubacteriaceae bacterium]
MKNNILIIEDEKSISRFLQLELSHEGYVTDCAYDGVTGLEKVLEDRADVIILDLMLPGLSGEEVCRRAREDGVTTPIIMLTAKDDVSDKVAGLDVGANDYMTKPFAIEELLARIRVAIKNAPPKKEDANVLKAGKLRLDKDKFIVTYDGEEVPLAKKEFDLLEYMMENKNIVLSREKLVENIWGYDYEGETNVTDVYIRYLRTKIDNKYGTNFIATVRGVGYRFDCKE